MGRPKNKVYAKIENPCKGVATYRTQAGAFVFHAHWSADPLKERFPGDRRWIEMATASMGGPYSIEALQEFEADDEAKAADRLYWAFDRERNVIPALAPSKETGTRGVPRSWPIYLGADFGERAPTAILFNAQDPISKRIYVFDSIYTPEGLRDSVKEEVYRKLSEHLDIPMKILALEGAYRHIERAVADPSALVFVNFYAREPWPVLFAQKVGETAVNKRKMGQSHVNLALWPSMVCCGVRHSADKVDGGGPTASKKCPLCLQEREVAPILYVLEGACPELVEQFDDLVAKEAAFEGLEAGDQAVKGSPDHATDGEGYVLFDMSWDPDGVETASELHVKKLQDLREKQHKTPMEQIELLIATAEEQKKEMEARMAGGRRKLFFRQQGREAPYGTIRYKNPAEYLRKPN